MFHAPTSSKAFLVRCKGCAGAIPTGSKQFSFESVVVTCPFCQEKRPYRPSEIYRGRPTLRLTPRSIRPRIVSPVADSSPMEVLQRKKAAEGFPMRKPLPRFLSRGA